MATHTTTRGVPYPDEDEPNNAPLFLQLLAQWVNDHTVGPDGLPDAVDWDHLAGKPATFPPSSHDHDGRYNTKTEIADIVDALNLVITSKAAKNGAVLQAPTLGSSDTDVVKVRGVAVETDQRARTFTYTAGVLTRIQETAGATVVRQVDLTYTGDQPTTITESIAGGVTVTTTLTYDGSGNLTGTTRSVA